MMIKKNAKFAFKKITSSYPFEYIYFQQGIQNFVLKFTSVLKLIQCRFNLNIGNNRNEALYF